MNKKTIVIGGVVVVLVVLIAVLAGRGGNSSGTMANTNAGSQTATTTESTAVVAGGMSATTTNGYANASFSFNYPASWQLVSRNPVTIINFNLADEKNDVVPMGGVEIKVATTTLTTGHVDDIFGAELPSATGVVTSTLAVNGVSCAVAQYTGAYVGGIATQGESVYCLKGISLWKIYLVYRAGDLNAASYVNIFSGVLASFKLLK